MQDLLAALKDYDIRIGETFSEAEYLRKNPDVKDAVRKGTCKSGLDHYVSSGCAEGRPGASPETTRLINEMYGLISAAPGDKLPPEELVRRVHGPNIKTFDAVGKIIAFELCEAIGNHLDLSRSAKVLDFGCGCGRILRYLKPAWPQSVYFGADIDPEAIEWCNRSLSGLANFVCSDSAPPIPFGNDTFDVIYSISVFTHLPLEMEVAWLKELRRVAKPGALLLLSFHGERLVEDLPEKDKAELEGGQFQYASGTDSTEGLPEFYKVSFHGNDSIRKTWSSILGAPVYIIPYGIARYQDLAVCRIPE